MTVILLDGRNALYRYGYAHQNLSHEGTPTGALFGFAGCLVRLKRRYPDAKFVAVWDGIRAKNWRTDLLPSYRQRTGKPDALKKSIVAQQGLLEDLCRCAGIPSVCVHGVEADDLIAILAVKLSHTSQCVIYSSDKDFCQLMHRGIGLIRDVDKSAGGRMRPETAKSVRNVLGCDIKNVLKVRAFTGDVSDGIPVAIRGIGPVSAAHLIEIVGVDPSLNYPPAGNYKLEAKVLAGWGAVRRNFKLMELVTTESDPRLGKLGNEVRATVRATVKQLHSSPDRDYHKLIALLSRHGMEEAMEFRHSLFNLQK